MACEHCGIAWCDSCRIFPPREDARVESEHPHQWICYGRKDFTKKTAHRFYYRCKRCDARMIKEHVGDGRVYCLDTYTHKKFTLMNCKPF